MFCVVQSDGSTPLVFAADKERFEVVEELIRRGANVDHVRVSVPVERLPLAASCMYARLGGSLVTCFGQ
jgi:hypothetical protein